MCHRKCARLDGALYGSFSAPCSQDRRRLLPRFQERLSVSTLIRSEVEPLIFQSVAGTFVLLHISFHVRTCQIVNTCIIFRNSKYRYGYMELCQYQQLFIQITLRSKWRSNGRKTAKTHFFHLFTHDFMDGKNKYGYEPFAAAGFMRKLSDGRINEHE